MGLNMAQVAATVVQYNEVIARDNPSVGDWANKQKGLSNRLLFVEAQRQSLDAIKKELNQLYDDWEKARENLFKKMSKATYKDAFAEIEKISALIEKDYVEHFKKYKEALHVLATGGRFEHCLGEIKPSQTYRVVKVVTEISDILPYSPGPEGTFEGLPRVGFRMEKPARLEAIKTLFLRAVTQI